MRPPKVIINMYHSKLIFVSVPNQGLVFQDVFFCILVDGLRWEVVVHFVDIGGIVDHQCLNFLFINYYKYPFMVYRLEPHYYYWKMFLNLLEFNLLIIMQYLTWEDQHLPVLLNHFNFALGHIYCTNTLQILLS
jgi:hypothetical protein